ncbi:MAG: hypothetical protein DCC75_05970 [Proteobacteria bacterium]|nr:MAG: hypothetical protein DCC75_05970 [Pseudomonadota bacterium]
MLCEIFAHPGAMSGIRIESITKGPALHQVRLLMGLTLAEMPVPAGEVFVTINTTGILEGELATYVLDARGGSPTVAKKVVHIP